MHRSYSRARTPAETRPEPTAGPGLGLRHVAVILDGNRRWAARQGKPSIEGYRRGGAKVHEFLGWCEGAAIPLVTLWPLSQENLNREPEELYGLISVIVKTLHELADSGRWRLRLIGDLDALPRDTGQAMRAAAERSSRVDGLGVNIAVAYSGRAELLRAMHRLLGEHTRDGSRLDPAERLDDADVARHIYTTGQPDPDLIIRTSGEQRLSGFMLWQAAFAELHFCPSLWPDFSRADFDRALSAFSERQRRYGL